MHRKSLLNLSLLGLAVILILAVRFTPEQREQQRNSH